MEPLCVHRVSANVLNENKAVANITHRETEREGLFRVVAMLDDMTTFLETYDGGFTAKSGIFTARLHGNYTSGHLRSMRLLVLKKLRLPC